MTTTNTPAACASNFWKKWWNALVNCFKAEAGCACPAEKPSAPKLEEAKAQEKKTAG